MHIGLTTRENKSTIPMDLGYHLQNFFLIMALWTQRITIMLLICRQEFLNLFSQLCQLERLLYASPSVFVCHLWGPHVVHISALHSPSSCCFQSPDLELLDLVSKTPHPSLLHLPSWGFAWVMLCLHLQLTIDVWRVEVSVVLCHMLSLFISLHVVMDLLSWACRPPLLDQWRARQMKHF